MAAISVFDTEVGCMHVICFWCKLESAYANSSTAGEHRFRCKQVIRPIDC